ncbi:MAG: PAS domain-containing protein [Bacteroidales bacterium]|nr:PAS domain-containing protein [Bacteroidales bacterium]
MVYTPFVENDKENGVLITVADITQKKQSEIDLKESEKKHKTLVKSLNEGLWQIDSKGKTVFANSILEKMFGYSKNEMKGRLFLDFMEKKYRREAQKLFEKRENGISEKHTFDFLKKDGSKITVYLSTSPLFDENNNFKGALALVKDITEINLAQKSLKESEERYKSLFYNNKTVNLLINPETKKIVDANNAALEFYGYSKNEMLKLRITDINILETDEIKKLMQISVEEKQNVFEFKHKLANGQIKEVNVYSGNIVFSNQTLVYSIIIDVSEKKKAEKRLKESEERYKTVVSNLPLVTFVINKNGFFEFSEGMGLSKLDLKPGQVVGLSAYDLYKDYPDVILAIKNSFKGQALKHVVNIRGVIFDVFYNPLANKNGKVTKIIGVANDITESKKIE